MTIASGKSAVMVLNDLLLLLYGSAMGGAVPFEDALAARLALFRPSEKTLAKFLDTRPPRYIRPGLIDSGALN
jgi:hypothetical protein